MTSIGEGRMLYAALHAGLDPRPSRFVNGGADYREWRERADEWHTATGEQ